MFAKDVAGRVGSEVLRRRVRFQGTLSRSWKGKVLPLGFPSRTHRAPPRPCSRRVEQHHVRRHRVLVGQLRLGRRHGNPDDGVARPEPRWSSCDATASARRAPRDRYGDHQLFSPMITVNPTINVDPLDQRRIRQHIDDIDDHHDVGQ